MSVQTQESWVPSLDDFAARIALVRHAMKWNFTQAGAATGLDGENWRLWERGRKPSDKEIVARQIAKASGVDYVWLLTGQDVRPEGAPTNPPRGLPSQGSTDAQGASSISWWSGDVVDEPALVLAVA